MGVSGCGKTTIGKLLAARLQVPFFDADDFHPQANVEKMKNSIPLTDEDRWPWLKKLVRKIQEEDGLVLACSALKESYRKILLQGNPNIKLVFLEGSEKLIRQRLENRKGHYMSPALLTSQFGALEIPRNALVQNISAPPEEIVQSILSKIT